MTRGLPGPAGSGEGRGGIGGIHSAAWPSPGEEEHQEAPQAALSVSSAFFWGNSLFLGGCICSVSRLQSLDIHRGDSSRGWSVTGPLGQGLCLFQLPEALPALKWARLFQVLQGRQKFSGEQIPGRDTRGKVREKVQEGPAVWTLSPSYLSSLSPAVAFQVRASSEAKVCLGGRNLDGLACLGRAS